MINPYKELPWHVSIDGNVVAMDMSFNNIMDIYDVLGDKSLRDGEKVLFALTMLLDEVPDYEPLELVKLWEELYKQYIKGPDSTTNVTYDIKGNPMPTLEGESERLFDLKQDMSYIFSSFMFDYGLNLVQQQNKLHWHEFLSLLNGLSNDCKLSKIIEIRRMEIPPFGKTPEEQKRREDIIKMKKSVALKESEEQ